MKKLTLAALVAVAALAACAQPQQAKNTTEIGGEWVLTTLDGQDVRGAVKANKTMNIDTQEKRFNATVGCNNLFGGVAIADGQMQFGNIASTMMACEASAMQMDQNVSASLGKTQSYQVQGNVLRLLDEAGKEASRWERK